MAYNPVSEKNYAEACQLIIESSTEEDFDIYSAMAVVDSMIDEEGDDYPFHDDKLVSVLKKLQESRADFKPIELIEEE
jgi:hypothetical protein